MTWQKTSSADICTDCHVFFNRSKHAGASDNVEAETDAVVNETNDTTNNDYTDTSTTTLPAATTGEEEDHIHQQHLQLEIQEVLNERAAILQKATMQIQQESSNANLQTQKYNNPSTQVTYLTQKDTTVS
jgi:hypothetical protein